MGLGGGAILILYFTSILHISHMESQGIVLIFIIPVAIVSMIIYAKKNIINPSLILKMSISGAVGAIIGSIFLKGINTFFLRKILGFFLLLMGIIVFFQKKE